MMKKIIFLITAITAFIIPAISPAMTTFPKIAQGILRSQSTPSELPTQTRQHSSTNYNIINDKKANLLTYVITTEIGINQLLNKRDHAQEDACSVIKKYSRFDFFGLYDGHNGNEVSNFLKERLGDRILQALDKLSSYSEETIISHIKKAMLKANQDIMKNKKYDNVGSTAVIAILDKHTNKLYIANLGDSRAILINPNLDLLARSLSHDHNAMHEYEQRRIGAAGGKVINGRINGLAPSRSFGDKYYKVTKEANLSHVMSEPEISVKHLSPQCKYLMLASDGLWDLISTEAVGIIIEKYQQYNPQQLAELLTRTAEHLESKDDISALIVKLNYNI